MERFSSGLFLETGFKLTYFYGKRVFVTQYGRAVRPLWELLSNELMSNELTYKFSIEVN
jgi:hypothetical protein